MNDRAAATHTALPLVCHVIFRLDYGGLENGLVNLINWMPADRYRHAILCLTHATRFRERIITPGVTIVEAHKQPGKDLGVYRRVYQYMRALRPAIVHTRNVGTLDMIGPAWLAGVRRFVHGEHGLDVGELDGRNLKYNLLRRGSRLAVGRYVSMSADLRRWLNEEIRVPQERLALIYSGVDTDRFRPRGIEARTLPAGFAPADAFVIGTVGRFEQVKDQPTLARAFVQLLAAQPALRARARLVMIGEGTLRQEVEQVLRAGDALDLAWLPGFRDDTPNIYRSLDLFVLPSRREGISNTLLEAMASGLPVVATRVGGNPEIVDEGVTGELVAADDAAAMAGALARYALDPQRAAAHGAAGLARVQQRFSKQAMVAGYLSVYDSIL